MRARTVIAVVVVAAPLLVVGSLTAGSLTRSQFGGEPVSDVVFPPQDIPLRFDHAQHLSAGVDCDFCHEDAPTSKSSLDNLIPTEEACDGCHDIDRDQPDKQVAAGKPPAACVACHPGYSGRGRSVARVRIPPPNVKFSHEAHVSRDIACTTCHGDLAAEKVGLATRAQLPKMKLCLTCHDGKQAPRHCTTCHLSAGGSRLVTEFSSGKLMPSGTLRGADHDLLFRTSHKTAAQSDPSYCANCHKKSFCTDCHNSTVKPMDFHGNDYVVLHPIEARRNNPDCKTCHRTQTFCVGCHSRSGVAQDRGGSEYLPPSSGMTGRRFHPEGWVVFGGGGLELGPNSRGANHHSFQAQRNIRQCASCHREEFCKGCHTAEPGSFRINPHPRNWRGSRRCRALAARAGRMCLRCHTEISEVDCNYSAP